MNWRRGLFRLWIVGTVLFLLAITVLSYSEIKQQFEEIALHNYIEARREVVVPQLCGNARGVAGTDYATQLRKEGPGPWDTYAKPNFFDNCWYVMPKFRSLYPEYKDMSDKELSRKLYAVMAFRSTTLLTHG
jgi:hypothetical protein